MYSSLPCPDKMLVAEALSQVSPPHEALVRREAPLTPRPHITAGLTRRELPPEPATWVKSGSSGLVRREPTLPPPAAAAEEPSAASPNAELVRRGEAPPS